MKNLTSGSVINGNTGEGVDSAQLKSDVSKLTENLPSYDTETVSPSNRGNLGIMPSRKEVIESRKVNHSQRTVIVPDNTKYGIPNAGRANPQRLEYHKDALDYVDKIPYEEEFQCKEEHLMRQPNINLGSKMMEYAKEHGINNEHSLKKLTKELNIPPIDIDELGSSEPQGVLLGMIDDMDKEVSFVEFAKTKHIKTMDCFVKRPNKIKE